MAARKAEKARVAAIPLAKRFSELLSLPNAALADQLKARKAAGGTGFAVTQPNRAAYVLTLQALMLAADAAANDLPDGESGVDGRQVKRKARRSGAGGTGGRDKGGRGGGSKRKARPGVHVWMDYEWTDEEADNFEVSARSSAFLRVFTPLRAASHHPVPLQASSLARTAADALAAPRRAG